jgi:UDP-glucose 4-epimerase
MKIFGDDWNTPDGTCIRDYVHVVDLIEAHIAAFNAIEESSHEIINLGSGTGYSVKEVLHAASEALGYKVPSVSSPRRAGDPAVLIADINKAKAVLGWSPVRDIKTMVGDAARSR